MAGGKQQNNQQKRVGRRTASKHPQTKPGVFISHAQHDRPLVAALKDFLTKGIGVPKVRVFATSLPGYGVPAGKEWLDHIHDKVKRSHVAVLIVTREYLSSEFCMWELGAFWARDTFSFALVDPILDPAKLPVLISTNQYADITQKRVADLNEFRDQVLSRLDLSSPPGNLYIAQRTRFQKLAREQVPALRDKPSIRLVSLMQTERRARFAEATGTLHDVFHRMRDASFIAIEHDLHRNDQSIRDLHYSAFQDQLKHVLDALREFFVSATGQSQIRTCIKQLIVNDDDPDDMYVDDVARDSTSEITGRRVQTRVSQNTASKKLFMGEVRVFAANNVIEDWKRGKYTTARWNKLPKDPPYRSVLVWPIQKLFNGEHYRLGFLCVDSKAEGVFDIGRPPNGEGDDFGIGAAVADTLYEVLLPWLVDLNSLREHLHGSPRSPQSL